jgi:hypothetical protein
MTRIAGTVREDLTDGCDNISLNSFIMRNFLEKSCREKT